jgi:hypothetical protein
VGVVDPHVLDDLIKLGRVPCEADLVGNIIDQHAGPQAEVRAYVGIPKNVSRFIRPPLPEGRPISGKARALSKMSCAKSDFRGETGLPDRCFIPGFAGTPGPPSKGGFCVSGSSDFPSLQAGLSGSVKR